MLTLDAIDSSSDDELLELLGDELRNRISAKRPAAAFVAELKSLPIGLKSMAATHGLDVSLALDDLGWHFGNWHNRDLAEETARGLEELGATELAVVFRKAFRLAETYWSELGSKDWTEWYNGSAFETAVKPLNKKAWAILKRKKGGILKYWIDYARRHPERLGLGN